MRTTYLTAVYRLFKDVSAVGRFEAVSIYPHSFTVGNQILLTVSYLYGKTPNGDLESCNLSRY